MRFDSLQPNDSPNVIKINAKKREGDKVRMLIQFFLQNKLFGWGAASMKKFN